jgi:protein tyrosine phosphatase
MPPIPVTKLSRALAEDVLDTSSEFAELSSNDASLATLIEQRRAPFTVGTHEDNVFKNSFLDIVPFDEHIVSVPSGAYVNASYVPDHTGNPLAYIATQGPRNTGCRRSTTSEFWEMVMTQHVTCIVMLCAAGELALGKSRVSYWGAYVGDYESREETRKKKKKKKKKKKEITRQK